MLSKTSREKKNRLSMKGHYQLSRAHGNDLRPHSMPCAKWQQLNQIVHCGAWQNGSFKLRILNDDTICEMSSDTPSKTKFQAAAPSRYLPSRSCWRKRPQSIWEEKSKDEKNSSRIEISAKHRKKVSKVQSSLRFTYLIIQVFRNRNQSSEVDQLLRWLCSGVVLG